ncbi:T9SS type A sorting domain-containing protein [Algoriphagus sp. NG3]|uniref:T9SS type A sorting domain-containing protein n=1 Tax=Algoriphagus sp. NG3 TaxID=3097546 RepID=UPI002A81DD9A|nr:T9SS type A sorting domain-containing protein [Algoriphagus sp. NG3]WPR76705.1 T9SS type A sorting domain-containing protein [Algoriphagus sp. NG3]
MRIKLFFIYFLVFSLPAFAVKKYASPNGSSSNSGNSVMAAWSLSFALGSSSPLNPGDSLMLADGVYQGVYVSRINGTASKPIKIMAMNSGKAIIDMGLERAAEAGIIINGNNTWFIGLHVTSSDTNRQIDPNSGSTSVANTSGITVYGDNNKLINCWIYDVLGGGVGLWRSGLNLEVYGCVIFNNGSQDAYRGHGHGMYIQHDDVGSPKQIINNFVFQNASQGINIYTTNPVNRGIIVDRNVSFNTGVMADFNPLLFRPPHNLTIGSQNNVSSEVEVLNNFFYSDLQGGRLNASQISNATLGRTYSPNANLKFFGNTVYGGRNQVEFLPTNNLDFRGNLLFNTDGKFIELRGTDKTYSNANWKSNTYINLSSSAAVFDGLSFSDWKNTYGWDSDSKLFSTPQKSVESLIVNNKYVPNLYYVTILNLSNKEIIELDLADFGIKDGQDYVIRDVQNPFDQNQRIVAKTKGSLIPFPMNWDQSMQPKGNMPHQVKHTDKSFGTFILEFAKATETARPEVKDSVAVYLDQDGKGYLSPAEYLKAVPEEDGYTYLSSLGPEVSCSDLGENEVTITIKHQQQSEEWVDVTRVYVLDTIAPTFSYASAYVDFDLVKGNVSIGGQDFEISDAWDNCPTFFDIEIDKSYFTCADIDEESGNITLPVTITVKDLRGNSTVRNSYVFLNFISSTTVSLQNLEELSEGQKIEIKLGDELEYEVLEWFQNWQLIPGEKSKTLEVGEQGVYQAKIRLSSGCITMSQVLYVSENQKPYPPVKEQVDLLLNDKGQGVLSLEQVFQTWPVGNAALDVSLSKSEFNCENIGVQQVTASIKDDQGNTWTEKFEVKVRDADPPKLETKDIEVSFDLSAGEVVLDPEDFVKSLSDNCGTKSLAINKPKLTCGDVGKEVLIEVEALDNSGNKTVKPAKAKVKAVNSKPVVVKGGNSFCTGTKLTLTLEPQAQYEVIGWRRNGAEIPNQKSKSLDIEESGSYHAIIRYAGGCLFETAKFEVQTIANPNGEIAEDGNILRAPDGEFTYKWFKNEVEIGGATSRTLEVHAMGEYAVELTNKAGCTARLAAVTMTISGILQPGIILSEELKIYPNPASSQVELQTVGDLEFAENSLRVYNSSGKDVSSSVELIRQSPSSVTLGISGLAAGTYVIMVESQENRMFVGKLMKR